MNFLERLKSDLLYVKGFRALVGATKHLTAESSILLADAVEEQVDAHTDSVFIDFEGTQVTYGELESRANKYANWGLSVGLKANDCVALLLGNEPDYIAFWFGMTKIGVRTALINYNLVGAGLVHCINRVSARGVVMGADFVEAFATARNDVDLDIGGWVTSGSVPAGYDNLSDLESCLSGQPDTRPERRHREELIGGDIALYIYTSGTTGLPKAAKITHSRALGLMKVFVPAVGVDASDRVLLTLPLYHATGGMCGVGCAINAGATLILRRKFSASTFWQEAIDTKATMLVYIGELGRYLMNQPPSPLERQHSIVKGFGNGLRADVWAEMVERTGIKRLVEFYGSTEGNVNFFNLDGRIGAVGRIPKILRKRLRARIVKFDVETETPVRGSDGFCIEAGPNEPGEAIGPISNEPRERFEGYLSEDQTNKKILVDVFEKGDRWFRTGDLMKKDKDGYIYFVDRVGDTFRWKSENVSTGEVEQAVSAMNGIEHAVVYGVEVKGTEGRAGMASVSSADEIDVKALYQHLAGRLAGFAMPVFLRIKGDTETTGTFKYRKVDLVETGFDPAKTDDPMFVIDADKETYRPVDAGVYADIQSGKVRL